MLCVVLQVSGKLTVVSDGLTLRLLMYNNNMCVSTKSLTTPLHVKEVDNCVHKY